MNDLFSGCLFVILAILCFIYTSSRKVSKKDKMLYPTQIGIYMTIISLLIIGLYLIFKSL
jgi:hypothetical protein